MLMAKIYSQTNAMKKRIIYNKILNFDNKSIRHCWFHSFYEKTDYIHEKCRDKMVI